MTNPTEPNDDLIARITALELVVQQMSRALHQPLDGPGPFPPTVVIEGVIGQAMIDQHGLDFVDKVNEHIDQLWWT